jgi:hypothetical protein
MDDFYNPTAGLYHPILRDRDESIGRQAGQSSGVIREWWGHERRMVLDASCGIGTQAIGLARLGFDVTASNRSGAAVGRVGSVGRGIGLDNLPIRTKCGETCPRRSDLYLGLGHETEQPEVPQLPLDPLELTLRTPGPVDPFGASVRHGSILPRSARRFIPPLVRSGNIAGEGRW